MKIHGIGVDLVKIKRVTRLVKLYQDKLAQRILSAYEMRDFMKSNSPENFLAKRFAAKEAAAKAIGTGFCEKVAMHEIIVKYNALGKPCLDFCGNTKQYVQSLGIIDANLSLSDEKEYVIAFVVIAIN